MTKCYLNYSWTTFIELDFSPIVLLKCSIRQENLTLAIAKIFTLGHGACRILKVTIATLVSVKKC
ncbi:hypothetical protein IQ225_02925 [Synechocystis salina LEGE 06155]|nr:hypothetical protein [Synechocystis salina LEGE 06155]